MMSHSSESRSPFGYRFMLLALTTSLICGSAVSAEIATTVWDFSAETLYDTGFMHMLQQRGGSVELFGLALVENDSPGAGVSEKGVNTDRIWGKVQGRKILYLEDPRAQGASLFFFFTRRMGKHPLKITINGHETALEPWKRVGYESVRSVDFPPEWLKKGNNVVDLSCPDAEKPEDGWELWLARADEFAEGGGDPSNVGKTSFKSFDGGRSWKESPFSLESAAGQVIDGARVKSADTGKIPGLVIDGTNMNSVYTGKGAEGGYDRAEYTVRFNLRRYTGEGWLESPVIDLWKDTPDDFFARMKTLRSLRIAFDADVPAGAAVRWYLRRGVNPGPFADGWEPYELFGDGAGVSVSIDGAVINRRYIQLRAEFTTTNPLVSPILNSAHIEADFEETFPVPRHRNIFVKQTDNPPLSYPSANWEWEQWDRPEFAELKLRENLDAVIAGSRTQFEAIVKLLDHATKRWRWTSPLPEYPAWDALSTLDRIEKTGGGGMCIQFNNLLIGMCIAYGWQARLVNIDGHEVCEVWSDDYGKWVYIDASNANHYLCDVETGIPMSLFDIHKCYLDFFHGDTPIDWSTDPRQSRSAVESKDHEPPIIRSSLTWHSADAVRWTGFLQSRILRVIPRNNWYEKPYPRPLSHGNGSNWPWNGYLCWYDDRTPPRVEFTWHTNRPRDLWPDLNKVHISAAQVYGNDRLALQFETYTPNFSHYEVNPDESGWVKAADHWMWLLVPGQNDLSVRAVNKQGVTGKAASVTVERVVVPMAEYEMRVFPE